MQKPVVEPPQEVGPAATWWMAGIAVRRLPLQPGRTVPVPLGTESHGDGLRRSRGQARRGKAGHPSRQPVSGERGNRPVSANPPTIQVGGGTARRLLTLMGRDGGSVVVRGRESRLHGEGTQRVRREGIGMAGGRR